MGIVVAGEPVKFDVRYVGDGYNDPKWQSRMLKFRRRFHYFVNDDTGGREVSFHIPSDKDYYFSLLYHCLVQKEEVTNLAEKYSYYLKPLSTAAGEPLPAIRDIEAKTSGTWAALERFMARYTYNITCPKDPNVKAYTRNKLHRCVSATNRVPHPYPRYCKYGGLRGPCNWPYRREC